MSKGMTETDSSKARQILESLIAGNNLAEAGGIPAEELDMMFEDAVAAYRIGGFADAEKVFRALCMLRHDDARCWMGLAGSCQSLGKYAEAVDAYGMAAYTSGLEDLRSMLYGGKCHAFLGDREAAIAAFKSVLGVEAPDTPENILIAGI